MSNPTTDDVNQTLKRIEHASTPARELAKEAVARHRRQSSTQLSQQSIDSGYDTEERRRRFVSASVKFKRRSIFARLRFW